MANTQQIETMITQMEAKLEETRDSIEWNAGPVRDAVRVIIPMFEDNIKIMRTLLSLMSQQEGEMRSRTDPRLFGQG